MSKNIKLIITILICSIQYQVNADKVTIEQQQNFITIANKTTQIKFNLKTGQYSGKNLQTNLTMFKNAKFKID